MGERCNIYVDLAWLVGKLMAYKKEAKVSSIPKMPFGTSILRTAIILLKEMIFIEKMNTSQPIELLLA